MEPKGIEDLVKAAMKDRPEKPRNTEDIWEKFLFIVFMGGKRSEPEIRFLRAMLKQFTGLEYVRKTDGDDWRENVTNTINERMKRIQDDEVKEMLREFLKELFRISASIKGGARFFKKEEITPQKLDSLLDTKEKAWEFIDTLAKNEDVSNVRYTKIIIWLQSMGYAYDFCAPTYQLKKFVNEHIGYYQFYEDDKYFMKKAEEFSEDVKKRVNKATPRDVSVAIFFYINMQNMLPARSAEKKKFSPSMLLKFLKSKKMSLKSLSDKLADLDEREDLVQVFGDFVHKNI